MLEKVIAIAAEAHDGVKDMFGVAYILHPLRVMMKMESEEEMTTAVLHDVVEDSKWTIDALRDKGVPEHVLNALDHLTRKMNSETSEKEPYVEFIQRAKENPLARKVKIADLEDNMDMTRITEALTEECKERLEKYHRAWLELK
ncbi:MAG: GTP pyrophosphokinase [Desulfomonilia bacterium]|nr:GTP pyrophosphokinase [Desulfomonilia bacterium]